MSSVNCSSCGGGFITGHSCESMPREAVIGETLQRGEWIQTHSRKKFFPLTPRPEDVCIEDIAHALSNLCRFTGHTREFYSVAQHSVLVSEVCPFEHALHGLLHDGSEAYISDLARPVKYSDLMTPYRNAEKHLQRIVYEAFYLDPEEPASVKRADDRLVVTERRDLLGEPIEPWITTAAPLPDRIIAWSPKTAKRIFLDRYRLLDAARCGGYRAA
jgi:uncharacterized protein